MRNYLFQIKKLLLLLILVAFSGINTQLKAQGKIGSVELVNKTGLSILSSDEPRQMNVFVQRITLEPGVVYKSIHWPTQWQFVGTLEAKGGWLKLYVNENELLRVSVSKGSVNESFWSWGILQAGRSFRFELL